MAAPKKKHRRPTLLVLTGGPGAGKTAVLDLAKKTFPQDVLVLPEAATVVFSGGFLRKKTTIAKKAAQRAIYRIQIEMERMLIEERTPKIILCDRGTLDGLAYWPGGAADFFKELGTNRNKELHRYRIVIHLTTPSAENGYNLTNPIRIETPAEAAKLDKKTRACWKGHPRRYIIDGTEKFLEKADRALHLIQAEIASHRRRLR